MRYALLAVFLLVMNALSAQSVCPVQSIITQHYGAGCNPVFQDPPEIEAKLDTQNCEVVIQIKAFPGCCNTFLQGRILVLGVAPSKIPLPGIGLGCTLLVNPVIILLLPASAGDEVHISLPPGFPPGTFYAQGAATYFTTIGFTTDVALTDGLQMKLGL